MPGLKSIFNRIDIIFNLQFFQVYYILLVKSFHMISILKRMWKNYVIRYDVCNKIVLSPELEGYLCKSSAQSENGKYGKNVIHDLEVTDIYELNNKSV